MLLKCKTSLFWVIKNPKNAVSCVSVCRSLSEDERIPRPRVFDSSSFMLVKDMTSFINKENKIWGSHQPYFNIYWIYTHMLINLILSFSSFYSLPLLSYVLRYVCKGFQILCQSKGPNSMNGHLFTDGQNAAAICFKGFFSPF